ncbi:MAG: asparagine synthase (glutamine-hydrolyzing) [Oscillospiraceae bacterium]|jgi:asparagine synthase (glutamine-hydrolysing)|nr:asparagine synthase (glutamine-hydrolyzing) [Oscillospiraceae bacterium]
MCGIVGWVDYKEDLSEKLPVIDKMSQTLLNRGPDESGVYKERHVLFAHRRLIVVDPEGGKQPMTFIGNGDKYTLIYNGEIYNTKEIKEKLKLEGNYEFESHSDTEVILKAYAHWKENCLEYLNGIFAFAVWDHNRQSLFLARDRMGVKPLFYYCYSNGIIFASEIKTLLANPLIKPIINEDSLNELFLLGPARTSGFGIIKGIYELERAEYLQFNKEKTYKKVYWLLKAQEFCDTKNEAIEKIRFLVYDAIERQLVSDVDLCCFLSGGLDSSIISKISSDYYKKNFNKNITTYSVDYSDNKKYFAKSLFQPNSDSEYVKVMSDYIQSDQKNITLDNLSLANTLDEALFARDLPGMGDIDSSLLLFCKEVKKNFTVVLSGECSDEIFGGYPWYHNEEMLFSECFPWSRSLELRKSIVKKGLLSKPEEYVKVRYEDTKNKADKLSNDSKLDKRIREMFLLNLDWFMQVLLDRKDRMSMRTGLEVRVPFCDHRIVEYAYNMPWHIKSLGGREKGIVREAMSEILPESIVKRKKSPYPKTYSPIYSKNVSTRVFSILNQKNRTINKFLDRDTVVSIVEKPGKITSPWYGQLMGAPQALAYIIQLDTWFENYGIIF